MRGRGSQCDTRSQSAVWIVYCAGCAACIVQGSPPARSLPSPGWVRVPEVVSAVRLANSLAAATCGTCSRPPLLSFLLKLCVFVLHTHHPIKFRQHLNQGNRTLSHSRVLATATAAFSAFFPHFPHFLPHFPHFPRIFRIFLPIAATASPPPLGKAFLTTV